MGNYISVQELEQRVGSERFQSLCAVPSSEQEPLAEGIIERAEALVDGFASARFQTPLEKTPLVSEWAFRIAEYELYKRSPASRIPEKIRDAYEDCISQLNSLAAGNLETGAVLKGKSSNLPPPSILIPERESLFDSRSMRGF